MNKKVLIVVCIIIVFIIVFMIALMAHRNETEPKSRVDAPTQEDVSTDQQEAQVPSSSVISEVTKDNFTSFPETDELAFGVSAEDNGWSITECTSEDEVIVIPEMIDGKPVVGIDGGAFFQNDTMIALVLPNTVEKIGRGAFMQCHNLKYVDLGDSLQAVGSSVFVDCTSLTSVTFPEGVTTFYGPAFAGCDALTEIYVPSSVKEMPYGILDIGSCPNAVVVTPAGSAVEADCKDQGIPCRNR